MPQLKKWFLAILLPTTLWAGAMAADHSILTVEGDSIGAGSGSTDPTTKGFAYRVASAKAWTIRNHSRGGYALADMMDTLLGNTVTQSSISMLLCCVNDMLDQGRTGANNNRQIAFRNEIYAAAQWLTIPTANLTRGIHPASTRGNWTASARYSGALVLQTSKPGSPAIYHARGTTAYVAYLAECAADPTPQVIDSCRSNRSRFTLSIDGRRYGEFSSGLKNRLSRTGRLYGPQLIRIPNLAPGRHTITITSSKGTDAENPVYVAWVAGNAAQGTSAPQLFLGDTLRMKGAAGYENSNGSDAAVADYDRVVMEVAQTLAEDGLKVRCVQASSAYDPNLAGNVAGDGMHPTDLGHEKIANRFLSAMKGLRSSPR